MIVHSPCDLYINDVDNFRSSIDGEEDSSKNDSYRNNSTDNISFQPAQGTYLAQRTHTSYQI